MLGDVGIFPASLGDFEIDVTLGPGGGKRGHGIQHDILQVQFDGLVFQVPTSVVIRDIPEKKKIDFVIPDFESFLRCKRINEVAGEKKIAI